MIFVVDIEGAAAPQWLSALGCDVHSFPNGVHYATNPARSDTAPPRYWFPPQLEGRATLTSPVGLIQTDPAYLERAVLPFAHWTRASRPDVWLFGIYRVMMDAGLRGYPLWLGDSASLAENPDRATAELGAWLGRPCSAATWEWEDKPPRAFELAPGEDTLLDEVHTRVAERAAFEPVFLDRIDDALAAFRKRSDELRGVPGEAT